MKSFRSQNYYEILGVARTASTEEIRGAFELSRHTYQENSLATYSLFTDEENQEILSLISRAFETLFHPELRKEYDAFLDGKDQKTKAPGLNSRPRERVPSPRVVLGGGRERPIGQHAGLKQQSPQQRPLPLPEASPTRNAIPPRPRETQEFTPASVNARRNDEAAARFIENLQTFNGAALRKIRQLRGLSVEDVAEKTKIRRTYIEYIEEEQFTFLPAPVYVKGFVTLIASMLELPPQEVAENYMHAYYQGHTSPSANGAP